MKLEITEATVLLTNGTDKIVLSTKLPCPFVPAYLPEQPPLCVSFDATYNTGVDYCRKLGLEPKVIDTRFTYASRSKGKTNVETGR